RKTVSTSSRTRRSCRRSASAGTTSHNCATPAIPMRTSRRPGVMADNIPAGITTGNYAELGDGIRLHYASAGRRGEPLMLFMHGFPEFWYAWKDLLPHYGQRRFAVAPDLRGY